MNKSDKEIDKLIHQALNKEEAEYFDQMGEQNIPQMVMGLFRGKNGWMNAVMAVINLAVFGVTVYAIIEMLGATVMETKLEWVFYAILGSLMMVLLKLWGWNQMDKNATIREIKRLEFQVSLLRKEQQKSEA